MLKNEDLCTDKERRVFLLTPREAFRLDRPTMLLVYFCGNDAHPQEDVIGRQHVTREVEDAGINALLVAPQFAVMGAIAVIVMGRIVGRASDENAYA